MRPQRLSPGTFLGSLAVAVVGLFTFEQLRLFVSGLSFGLRAARDLPVWVLGLVGTAMVALSVLAVAFSGGASRRRAVQLTTALVVVRGVSQLVDSPLTLLMVSAIGIVLAGITIPTLAIVFRGQIVGVGLLLGAALDIAIMAASHTFGLARSSGGLALGIVVALGVLAVLALMGERRASSFATHGPAPPGAAVFAVGPWMAIHLTVTGNLGFVGAASGFGFVVAATVCAVGAALALAWVAPGRASPQPALASSVLVASLWLLAGADGSWAIMLTGAAAVSAGGALTGAFERVASASASRLAWAGSAGFVVGFVSLVAFYLPFALPDRGDMPGLLPMIGLPILGAGIACLPHQAFGATRWLAPTAIASALLVVPLVVWTTSDVAAEEQLAGDPFVLTYSLNHGFSADGRLALEEMADVIANARPDILALQEVSRGWVATGGIDMVAWLEHRLGMPIVFAPTAHLQWGLAVGSRLPISDPAIHQLADYPSGLDRAALDVTVDVTATFSLRVVVVQLDEPAGDDAVRLQQVSDLLNVWADRITPSSPETSDLTREIRYWPSCSTQV